MELKEAINIINNFRTWYMGGDISNDVLQEIYKSIDTVLNRLEDLENRYLHLIIGGRTYQILNNIKKLQCVDLGNNEFTLEVLEKWK